MTKDDIRMRTSLASIQVPDSVFIVDNTSAYLAGYEIFQSMVENIYIDEDENGGIHLYLESRKYEASDAYQTYHNNKSETIWIEVWGHIKNDEYAPEEVPEIDRIYILLNYADANMPSGKFSGIARDTITIMTPNVTVTPNETIGWTTRNWGAEVETDPSWEGLVDGDWFKIHSLRLYEEDESTICLFDLTPSEDDDKKQIPIEAIPIMSPDALRASLNFLNDFNDTHPKRNTMYTDTDGNKYIGTTENFGDEIFIESRKLLLDKPSLKKAFTENTFSDYFDIRYSELLENLDQQNMLVAVLKDKVLSAKKTYKLKFENCKLGKFIRAVADGNDEVTEDKFYVTEDPPVLIVEDIDDPAIVQEFELKLLMNESLGKYMWHDCLSTSYMVDSITGDSSNIFSVVINLDNKWKNFPFVWYVNDELRTRTIPEYEEEYEADEYWFMHLDILPMLPYYQTILDEVAALKAGIDGQGKDCLYLHITPYEDTSVYNSFEHRYDDEHVQLRIHAHGVGEENATGNVFINKTADVAFIDVDLEFYNTKSVREGGYPFRKIACKRYTFTNNKDIKISLKYKSKDYRSSYWGTDTDEGNPKGMVYNETLNACKFNDPIMISKYKPIAILFDLNDKHDPSLNESESGVHISTGTEYTNHCIIKNTGNIHNLDKFDGLPPYFGKLHGRDLHKSHVDLYAIRGLCHDRNQRPIDKQTAAIILDSGIPQTEIIKPEGLPVSIYYDGVEDDGFIHRTNEELVTDKRNCLTDTVYVSEGVFGNAQNPQHMTCQKFVYHGDGYFSLGVAKLDPEYEFARAYAVTNDPIKYLNNLLNPRPERTLARICDIPTDFHELVFEDYKTPNTIFDPKCVLSETSFKYDDLDVLLNQRNIGSAFYAPDSLVDIRRINQYIFPFSNGTPSGWFHPGEINEIYGIWENLDAKADLRLFSVRLDTRGTGYAENDTFYIMIGGLKITGTVESVTAGGVPGSVSMNINSSTPLVDPNNIGSDDELFETFNIDSEGSGMVIGLSCDPSYWETLQRTQKQDETQEVRAYMYDEIGNIWLWTFDASTNTWNKILQITGETDPGNIYDTEDRRRRTLSDSLIHNIVKYNSIIDEECINARFDDRNEITFDVTYDDGYDEQVDITDKLSGNDIVGGVYTVTENHDYGDKGTVHQFTVNLPKHGDDYANTIVLPNNNELNLDKFYNVTNKFVTTENNTYQPDLYLFFPNHSTRSKLPNVFFNTDHGTVLKSYYGDITYCDILYQETDGIRWINPNSSTISNIYHYNEYAIPEYTQNEKTRLMGYSKDMLRAYCNQEFGLTPDESKYMTREELFTYAYTHFIMKRGNIYKRDGIKLEHHIDDIVQTGSVNAMPVANGPQPIGEYMSVTQSPMNIDVKIESQVGYAPPLYFFELEDDSGEYGLDESIRVYDEYDNDISLVSMIIKKIITTDDIRYERYIFRNNKWIKIIK